MVKEPTAAMHAVSEDLTWVKETLEDVGVAVVPILSQTECDKLVAAMQRSLSTPGMSRPSPQGGMVNIFFLPEKEVLIMGHPRVHAALAAGYGKYELNIQMHERMNCKVPGAAAQELHIDVDIFHPTAKPRDRLQVVDNASRTLLRMIWALIINSSLRQYTGCGLEWGAHWVFIGVTAAYSSAYLCRNPIHLPGSYPARPQAMVCFDIDQEASPEDHHMLKP